MEPVYVLKENYVNVDPYYHAHGAFRDQKHVVKQTDLKYARRFPSREAAEDFNAGLPTWLVGRFAVKEVSGFEQCIYAMYGDNEMECSMDNPPLGLMFAIH